MPDSIPITYIRLSFSSKNRAVKLIFALLQCIFASGILQEIVAWGEAGNLLWRKKSSDTIADPVAVRFEIGRVAAV